MNVVRYDPFRELRSLQNDINRLFTVTAPDAPAREDMLTGEWVPRVNIFENEDNLVIEAELPGMKREDFELSFENNVITLKGERRFEKKAEGDNYHRIERSFGSFSRSFTLPQTVTAEGARAEFANGILTVALAKREDTKARKIDIIDGDAAALNAKPLETSRVAGA